MPYLHLDVPFAVSAADRSSIAGRLARLYADVMETNPERVTVAFRELGENGVVRTGADGEVEPVVVVQCDIRRGRHAQQRERLGAAVAVLLEEALGWPPARTILEFTQHAGDEFWREGGLSADWTPTEAAARGWEPVEPR
jgi:phenylpyruvate tautomerase PptA (4-oxalocrotonate tautomerase family)